MMRATRPATLDSSRLLELVDRFTKLRIAVFGDLIVDEFIYGDISRVSREAPVLILNYDSTDIVPGGAGNAASNVAALGVLVFGYEWSRNKNLAAFVATWPLPLPLIPALLFAGGTKGGFSYGTKAGAYKFGIFVQTLREQSLGTDVLTLGFLLLILLVALCMRRIDGRLGWAALMFGVLSLAMF